MSTPSSLKNQKVGLKNQKNATKKVCAERETGRRVYKVTNCLNPGGAIEKRL